MNGARIPKRELRIKLEKIDKSSMSKYALYQGILIFSDGRLQQEDRINLVHWIFNP